MRNRRVQLGTLLLLAPIALLNACSDQANTSMLARHNKDLHAGEWVVRKLAAGYLVKMCCPTAEQRLTLGPPSLRPAEGLEACHAVAANLRTNRDPVVLDGILEESWYPECVVDIPAEALLAVLVDADRPKTRSEIVWRLADYEPTDAIVDALLEELRRDPGDLSFPLHDKVAFVISDLGERHLGRVIEVMRVDPSTNARRGAATALRLAASDSIALPQLEPAFENAATDRDEIVAKRAIEGLAAYRESTARDEVTAADALVQRASGDSRAIIRLGTRRVSCASRTAAEKLEELADSAEDYWDRFRAKRAFSARATMCKSAAPL